MTASSTRTSRADDYAAAVAALTSRGRFGISLGLERVEAHPGRAGPSGARAARRPGRRHQRQGQRGGHGPIRPGRRRAAGRHHAEAAPGQLPRAHRHRRAAAGRGALRARRWRACCPPSTAWPAQLGPPTEFEALTAAAFAELAAADVDLVLVEVGMGGRLDATNVLDAGVAAITNVQLDHERYLGQTLAAIGTEKAAIIKRGNLAVTGATGRGLRPIVERARQLGVPLSPGRAAAAVSRHRARGRLGRAASSTLHSPDGVLRDLHVGLLGSHQAGNAAVALALLDALRADAARRGAPLDRITDATIRAGLRDVRWPGRLELLRGDALRRRAAGRGAQPGRRPRPRPGPRRAGDAPLPARLRRDARQAGAGHAARPGRAGARSRSSRAVDDPGARSPRELLDAWQAHRRASRSRRRRPQAGAGAGGRAAPLRRTSRSWWPAPSTWSARCVPCWPARRRRHDRAALGRAHLRDGDHQHHARLVQRRRPGARRAATSTRSSAPRWSRHGASWRPAPTSWTSAPSRRARRTPTASIRRSRRSRRPPSPCRPWPRWPREFGDRALVSIDTIKGEVARQALAAGATIVNDVWAGRSDPDHHDRRRRRRARTWC